MRPEFLTSAGDTLAAQSAMALAMLEDGDAFFAFLQHSLSYASRTCRQIQTLLGKSQEVEGGEAQKVVTLPAYTPGLNGMLGRLEGREEELAAGTSIQVRVSALLDDLRLWHAYYDPGFSSALLKERHFLPVMRSVEQDGSPTLAARLQEALELLPDFHPKLPVATLDLAPIGCSTSAEILGGSWPFNLADGGTVELDVSGTPASWVWEAASAPFLMGPGESREYVASSAPSIQFESETDVYTPTVLESISVQVFPDGSVRSHDPFTGVTDGMILQTGVGQTYTITEVVDINTVWCADPPAAGLYPACTVFYPTLMPFTVTAPGLGLVGEDLLIIFPVQSYTAETLAAMIELQYPDLFDVTFAVLPGGSSWVRAAVKEEGASVVLSTWDLAEDNTMSYLWLGVEPGDQWSGTDANNVLTVRGRLDGAIVTRTLELPPDEYTPGQLMAEINSSEVYELVAADTPDGVLRLTGFEKGDCAWFEVEGLGMSGKAVGVPETVPEVGVDGLAVTTPPQSSEWQALTLDGTNVVVLPEGLEPPEGVEVTECRLRLKVRGERLVSSYVIWVWDEETREATLTLAPDAPKDEEETVAAEGQLYHAPLTLTYLNPSPTSTEAYVQVVDSVFAQSLGLYSTKESCGSLVWDGGDGASVLKPGYWGMTMGVWAQVVGVDPLRLEYNDELVYGSEPVSGVEFYSPGAKQYKDYLDLAALTVPTLPQDTPQDVMDFVIDLQTRINALTKVDDSRFRPILEFVSRKRLEVLQYTMQLGSVKGFFSATESTVRPEVSAVTTVTFPT